MSGPHERERETMGSPEPDEQGTDVMGGDTRRGREGETMGSPEPDERGTDVMGDGDA